MHAFILGIHLHPGPLALSVFGMGLPELAVITGIALVIFGPKKLPELGSSLGKALKGFKQEMDNPSANEETEESAVDKS
jgi:sec-independent protein translocase protein TatA